MAPMMTSSTNIHRQPMVSMMGPPMATPRTGPPGPHERPPAHGLDPVAPVEGAEDEGHGGRAEAGSDGAAEDPGEDQDPDVGSGGRQGGDEEEVDHADEVEAAVAPAVRQLARPAGP